METVFTNTNVLLEKKPYQEFKKQLIDKGMSFSQWVRDKIDEELSNQAIMEELKRSQK